MSFEGSEKRIEIEFGFCRTSSIGLRQISRDQLDQLMHLTRCNIISARHTSDVDAYVLSESSLFVRHSTFILKTCGRTQILNGLGRLLEWTVDLGMYVRRVKYSRASFLFPDAQVCIVSTFSAVTSLVLCSIILIKTSKKKSRN